MEKARLLSVLIATTLCVLALPVMASALTLKCPNDTTPSGGETPEDPEDPETPTVVGGCDSVPATLKHYLLQAGYDENAAAGIMGNISAESCGYKVTVYKNCSTLAPDGFKAYISNGNGNYTLNSAMSRNDGFGLVQWTPDSNPRVDRLLRLQKYADSQGKAITDLEVQIEFILAELTTSTYGSYYSNVLKPEKLNGRSIEDVTWRVLKWYEAPASVRNSPGYGAVSQVCTDQNASWCKSLKKRVSRARDAKQIDGNCSPTSGGSGGGSEPPTEVPVVEEPVTPEPEPTPTPTPTPTPSEPEPVSTSGALGKQSASNAISQTSSGVKNTPWLSRSSDKKIGVYDNGNCCGSGCSLIAVANAYGAVHSYSSSQIESFANDLAAWAKNNVNSPSDANTKKMLNHVGMSYSRVWSSKSASESAKISAIRTALASGGAIVAAGDREGTDASFCTSTRLSNGECVFTPGGHWVAIIGITADNKLVIGNPGKSNGRNWVFPASTVLRYSNIGYSVK